MTLTIGPQTEAWIAALNVAQSVKHEGLNFSATDVLYSASWQGLKKLSEVYDVPVPDGVDYIGK